MMAAIRKFQAAIGGNNTVAGTGNAITITTLVGIDAANVTNGFRICFIATATNTGATTVAIDGLSPVAIKRNNGDDLALGDITTGGIYDIAFDGLSFKLLGAGPSLGTYGTLTGPNTWTGPNSFIGDVHLGDFDDVVIVKGQPVSPFIANMLPKGDALAVRAYLGIGTTDTVGFHTVAATGNIHVAGEIHVTGRVNAAGDVEALGYLRSSSGLLLGSVNPFTSNLYEQSMLNSLTNVGGFIHITDDVTDWPYLSKIPIKLATGSWGWITCV